MWNILGSRANCPKVTVVDLLNQIESNDSPFLLDVREPSEVVAVSFKNSINIPMSKIRESLSLLPKDRRIVVICRSGSRSARVVWQLLESGYKDVRNLDGGIMEWNAKFGYRHLV